MESTKYEVREFIAFTHYEMLYVYGGGYNQQLAYIIVASLRPQLKYPKCMRKYQRCNKCGAVL